MKKWQNYLLRPIILNYFIVFFAAVLIIFYLQGRLYLSDFKVYFGAARDLWLYPIEYPHFGLGTEQTGFVYDKPYGLSSGYYKYSPLFLLIITPLALLPWVTASVIYFIIHSIAITFAVFLSYRFTVSLFFTEKEGYRPNISLFLLVLISGQNLYREIWLGNINIFLLLGIFGFLYLYLKDRVKLASFCLAMAIVLKPHFIVFLPFLFLWQKWRYLMMTTAFISLNVLLPFCFVGIGKGTSLTKGWLTAMSEHASRSGLIENSNTLYHFLYRWFDLDKDHFNYAFALLAVCGVVYLLFVFALQRRLLRFTMNDQKPDYEKKYFAFSGLVLLAVIPNITNTDFEHFLFSMPLIIWLLFSMTNGMNKYLQIFLILCFIAYGGNWHDMLGNELSGRWTRSGALGIANLAMIGFSMLYFLKEKELIFTAGSKK